MMKKRIFVCLILAMGIVSACSPTNDSKLAVVNTRLESATNPLGIDHPNPRFSWQLQSGARGTMQSAYRILVASSAPTLEGDQGDLWDSGVVQSPDCLLIPYAGKLLSSGTTYHWKVQVWDQNGNASAWSDDAHWTMGKLDASEWKAQWIGLDRAVGEDDPEREKRRLSARMLRKEIEVSKPVERALAYVCGVGLFEWYLNGQKVGDQVLAAALSDYEKRAYYMMFDVTDQLNSGTNAIGVILGNGRYFAPRIKDPAPMTDYGFPKLLFQMEITFTDGSIETFISDGSWTLTADGPIRANNEYDGEYYDATMELPGWDEPGFDDSDWIAAELVAPAAPLLRVQPIAPIRITETLKPLSVEEISPGVFIADMGQNMVGWVQIRMEGPRGTALRMRFAETLQEDGNLYMDNKRGAEVTNTYILKGGGLEVWEPRFTYHGFRYVEITGYPGKLTLADIEGRVVHDDLDEIGHFESSNTTINTIYRNAHWGMRGNYRSIPTDCPQRDERQAWQGDRAIGSRGESFMFDLRRFYVKWMQDIQDSQRENGSLSDVVPNYWKFYNENVTWPAAYPVIVAMLYEQYGDIRVVEEHYPTIKKWADYMKLAYMNEFIITRDIYGDWCMPPESPELIRSQDPARQTDGALLATSYYYHVITILQDMASLLELTDDVAEYASTAEAIFQAYNAEFFDPVNTYYGNNTATSNLLSLAFGLVPEAYEQAVFDNIVDKTMIDFDGHISTGLIGAQWIMRSLTRYGRADIAYKLATNTTYPSWGYMIENGATTIWELWNGNTADPAMNSHNHVMLLGDLIVWYYENLAGIKSDWHTPGFKHIIMKPVPVDGLSFVKASHHSGYGQIVSEWNKQEGVFNWYISIPPNTRATVYVPARDTESILIDGKSFRSNKHLHFLNMDDGYAVFDIDNGAYSFRVRQ